jgi:Flp pilus assembly protein TadG
VELAVCIPMLIVLTMGTLETTDYIFLRERLKTAAYEGARTVTAPNQTAAAATAAANAVLTQRGIVSGSVSITPSGITESTLPGTRVTVTATAPFASNCYMTPYIISRAITNANVTVTMIRQ